jgi:uncharacterized paraquat-inducible protein A
MKTELVYCLECERAAEVEQGNSKAECPYCGAWFMDLMPWSAAVEQWNFPVQPVIDGKTRY